MDSTLSPFTEKPIFEFSIQLIDRQFPGIPVTSRNDLIMIMKDYIQRRIPYETARDKYMCIVGNTSPIEKMRDVLTMQDQPIKCSFDGDDGDSKNRRKMQKWSAYEDNRLLAAIYRFGIDNWALISKFVGNGRTRAQCSQRWARCLNPRICKDTWDSREDSMLFQLVQKYGDHSWTKIADYMKNRSDVQCRYRYSQISKEMQCLAPHRVAFPSIDASSRAHDSAAVPLQAPKLMGDKVQHRYSMPVIQVIHTYVLQQPNVIPQQQIQSTLPTEMQQRSLYNQAMLLDNFLGQFQH